VVAVLVAGCGGGDDKKRRTPAPTSTAVEMGPKAKLGKVAIERDE
jgi:hypothetical protein